MPMMDTLPVGKLRLHTYVIMKMSDGPRNATGSTTEVPCTVQGQLLNTPGIEYVIVRVSY